LRCSRGCGSQAHGTPGNLVSELEVTMTRLQSPRRLQSLRRAFIGMTLFSAAAFAQTPSIEGTYQLVSRTLADGTITRPPEIVGLWNQSKGQKNFNLLSKNAAGKYAARSSVATYRLTPTEYSETLVFLVESDQASGKEVVYNAGAKTGTSPIKVEGGRLQFKSVHTPNTLAFEGSKLTVTGPGGAFVDVWQRMQ
jgi:hypothetical protein